MNILIFQIRHIREKVEQSRRVQCTTQRTLFLLPPSSLNPLLSAATSSGATTCLQLFTYYPFPQPPCFYFDTSCLFSENKKYVQSKALWASISATKSCAL